MGFSQSWLAVRGERADQALETLSLVPTGEFEEAPEFPVCGLRLPSGWYLVIGNRFDFAERQPLASLSRGGEVVTFFVEEHAMATGFAIWREGREFVSIEHDAQEGDEYLEFGAADSDDTDEIMDRLSEVWPGASNPEHAFDVPVEIALAVTGYRYNKQIVKIGEKPFERLERIRKKWWSWR